MKRKRFKISALIALLVVAAMVMTSCGEMISAPTVGNAIESSGETKTDEVPEISSQETTAEEPTTDEPTEEEPTTEVPTTKELPTRETTPYVEVLDEYFAEWEEMYIAQESTKFNSDEWKYIQEWKKELNIKVVSAEVIYSVEKVLSESDSEVRLGVGTGIGIDYICIGYEKVEWMWFGLPHVVRLAKTEEGYKITSDSWWDMFSDDEAGLEEDIEWLKSERNGDPLRDEER